MPPTSADAASSSRSTGIAASRRTRSTSPGAPCTPAAGCSPTDRSTGCSPTTKLIADLGDGVPKALIEVAKLGRTLKKRVADMLAYFDRPGTSNGPT